MSEWQIENFRRVWNHLKVPVRPGPEGLAVYRDHMKSLEGKNILVLGATPELVDMALDIQFDQIVSIERDPDIMEAMRQLGTRDWRKVTMIRGNWLDERPEFKGAFDCVVCDGGLLFLDYPQSWIHLFLLVYGYLKPGGIFIAKEWAEPAGKRTYASLIQDMIKRFETENLEKTRDETIEAYRYLASELRLATFIGTTKPNLSFDQEIMMERLESLTEALHKKFPDPQMVEITDAALKYLARSQPDITDTVAGARFEAAQKLLSAQGFHAHHFPLPDRPVAGANYMFVAWK